MDLSRDLLLVADGLEIVTLRRRSGEIVPALHGLRRPLVSRQAPGDNTPKLLADVRWHLAIAECPIAPAPGEMIIDSQGRRWTVLESDGTTLESRWMCTCCNLVMAYQLDAVISIDQAEFCQSAGGIILTRWHTWRSGVRARITPQPLPPNAASPPPRRYNVLLGEPLGLDRRHRIRTAEGRVYHVVGYRPALDPGQLALVEVEET